MLPDETELPGCLMSEGVTGLMGTTGMKGLTGMDDPVPTPDMLAAKGPALARLSAVRPRRATTRAIGPTRGAIFSFDHWRQEARVRPLPRPRPSETQPRAGV